MRYRIVILLGLTLLVGCRSGGRKPPKPPDLRPPIWEPILKYEGMEPAQCPNYNDVVEVLDDVTRKVLNLGSRPPTMPKGGQVSRPVVKFVRTCSTSGESNGDGAIGVDIKAWRCTTDKPIEIATQKSWIGHFYACHLFGPTASSGNAGHERCERMFGY